MTTIRKIVTSKVDGSEANNTTDDEIRPYGEIAVYLDTSTSPNKPTLMMFDGVRTHLKSKVLAPGRVYGSDADAGDGSTADTIKLIPDATLYNNGSNQYIVVDPTGGEPGHIHLRAGGTQDNSSADLYLGGEETCVRVSDTSGSVTIRTTNQGDPDITLDWSFQQDGNLYFPGIGNNRIGESEPGLVVSSDASVVLQSNNNIVNTYEVEFIGYVSDGFGDASGATLTVTEIIAGTITDGMTIYGAGLPPEGWVVTFDNGLLPPVGSGGTGNYLLSGANILTSSQSFNNDVLAAGSNAWIFGADGKLTLPGNIATLEIDEANPDGGLVVSVDAGIPGSEYKSLYKFGRGGQFTSRAISVTNANGDRVGGLTGDGFGPILNAPADKEVWISTDGQHLWRFTADRDFVLPYGGGNIRSEGNINIDINLSDSTMRRWQFGEDGDLTVPGKISGGDSSGNLDITASNYVTIESTDGGQIMLGANQLVGGNNGTVVIGHAGNITDLNSGKLRILNATVPTTSVGAVGDVAGFVAFDASYIYYCTGAYDSVTNIWKRVAWSGDTW